MRLLNLRLLIVILSIVLICIPISITATSSIYETDGIDLQLRLAPPQSHKEGIKHNVEEVSTVHNHRFTQDQFDESAARAAKNKREMKRIGQKRRRREVKEKQLFTNMSYRNYILVFLILNNCFINAMDEGQDPGPDLSLKLGPYDASNASPIPEPDGHNLQAKAVPKVVQKAMQENRPLTASEKREVRLEKKRLYMREKQRKIEEMGLEFVAMELKRKRENQRRYVANIKKDPERHAVFLKMRAEAGKEYRKQEKAIGKQTKRRLKKPLSVEVERINTIEEADRHEVITPIEYDVSDNARSQNEASVASVRSKLPIKRKRNAMTSKDDDLSKSRKGPENAKGLSRHQIYRMRIKERGAEAQEEEKRKNRERKNRYRKAQKDDPKAYAILKRKTKEIGRAWYAALKKDPKRLAARRENSKKNSAAYRERQNRREADN
ncbi:uncharacterized protein FA14DRAFT_155565 [Meira miltonrushii]|uniref:Uncharacterized protein n=1 Tax=Meira miltonrushii TaxID=1280837 RepID=A0A316VIP0_9BASI|nr:uncharacterized protein FA14DRAFT_155565 [Meira miltonrushii]PWN36163.1 hypothetical protein FA14DRAFT_155565 [Meira miltonrushii]